MPLDKRSLRYPGLWRDCVASWCAALGRTGSLLVDHGPFRRHVAIPRGADSGWGQYDGVICTDHSSTSHKIAFTDIASMFPGEEGTVCVWGYCTQSTPGTPSFGGLWHWSTSSDRAHWPLNTSVVYDGSFRTVRAGPISIASLLTPLKWQHLAVTRNASAWTVYVDGAEVYSTSAGTWGIPATCYLGGVQTDAQYWAGGLTDLRLYRRALSPSEMKLLATRPAIAFEQRRKVRAYSSAAGGFQSAWTRGSNVLIGAPGY